MDCKIVIRGGALLRRTAFFIACFFFLFATSIVYAQVSVLTHHNDNARTGANLNETILNTTNVNLNEFGKLFSYPVDAHIYTQPLYVPGVSIPGKGTHNVIYVATQNDSVYAFDADTNTGINAQPLWQVNFTNPPNITPVPAEDVTSPISQNIQRPGLIGIMGTPVIDPSTNTMYLVARTKETVGTGCSTGSPCYMQRLHALDITSGAEKFGGPKTIQATVSGSGAGNVGGFIQFDPRIQNQRPGLVLDHGIVYIAWSSHDDRGSYHGWVIGYDAATLQQTGVFNATPDGSLAGIWQSGQPPAVDADGNLYLMTGNGTFDASIGGRNVGESFVKLKTQTLDLLDWFAQHDVDTWNLANEDLNSGGPLLIPGSLYLIGGGKQGRFFVLDKGNLGHYNATDSQIPQTFQATNGGHIHGSPVIFDSPTLGRLVYVWGETDFLKGFSFNGSTFNPNPVTQSLFPAPPGMPGGFLSISANGVQPGTGILWANMPYSRDAEDAVVDGVLRAFDASDLSRELWNSRIDYTRDDYGNFAKYTPPTVANGKVYVATFSGQLVVYGLNPPPPSGILFLQQANATPQQTTATVPVTYSANQTAGALNIVVVGWNDATSTIQSVTDSRGNIYNLAVGPNRGTGLTQSIYYATNISGGSNTVTVRFNQAVSFPDIRILEYYGVDSVNPIDAMAGTSGNSGQSSSGAVTTSTANDLLFAATTVATKTTQAGFPFVARAITPNFNSALDAIVIAAGTYNATATVSAAGPWVMQMVAFKGIAPPVVPDTQPPTVPSNLTASAASSNQINLSWTASTDDVGVTGYQLERCQGVGCTTFAQVATPAGTSYNDLGLTAGTSYSYRVRAMDAVPNLSGYSGVASATTLSPDTQAPTVPGNLTATAASASQINLSWTASTDNVGVTGYQLERCQGAGCTTFAQVATPVGTTYSDAGLTAGTSYSYRVRATDAVPNLSGYSAVASATTLLPPSGLVLAYGFNEGSGTSTADSSGNSHAGVLTGATWTTLGKFGNAAVFNGTNSRVSTPNASDLQLTTAMTLEAWVNPSTVSSAWRDVIFKGNDNYYLMGTTTNNSGRPGAGVQVGSPPSHAETFGTALLLTNTWTHLAATYDGATLRLYVNGVQVSSLAKTGNILTSTNPLEIGGDSIYGQYFAGIIDEVRIYNRALSASEIQTDMNSAVTNPVPDTQAPTAPGNLTATVAGASQINLSWTASTDNVGVTGYRLERCQGGGCTTFAQIATPAGTSYSDTSLVASTTYSYRVRAADAANNLSPYSATVSATTAAPGAVSPPVFSAEAHSATDGAGAAFNQASLSLNVSGANSLLIAAWHAEFDGGLPDSWTVTNNGVPGTLITETDGYTGGTGNRRFRIYYWLNPTPGANTISVSNPTTGANELAVSAILLNNVNQTNPLGTIVLDVSPNGRTGESETVPTTTSDLVVHVIADALYVTGTLGSGETSRSVANDGLHQADGDASLWISTKPEVSSSTNVSSSGWPCPSSVGCRVINGVAIAVHGN